MIGTRSARLRATHPRIVGLTVVTAVGLALAGCTPGGASPTAQPTSPATSIASPSPASSPSPSASLSPTPETPAPVELTGDGIGAVLNDTPDALRAVEALLGAPDTTGDWGDCGMPFITSATWGDLEVTANDGALHGWQLGGPDHPSVVALPFGADVGAPLAEVAALPGASEPSYLDSYDLYTVGVGGVEWWFSANEPTSPAVVIGSRIVGCG